TWMARHVIGLNHVAIGVENVGGEDGVDNLTDAQIEANIRLVRYLAARYPTIEYLIGHSEYRAFEDHPLWRELDADYRTTKIDPGQRFMDAVRRGVADLDLEGPPRTSSLQPPTSNLQPPARPITLLRAAPPAAARAGPHVPRVRPPRRSAARRRR
ncbi:MAG: N-acetylmuramoyl-L-alanine amidase, partial [Longimicrobiales bacterium]